jgi:predicted anti-sigma-YlaC factor YlaD
MKCERVRELLSAYLDAVLVADESVRVARHIQTCSRCSGILADFRTFDALLAQLPRVEPDPFLQDNFFAPAAFQELVTVFGTAGCLPYRSRCRYRP